MFNERNKKLLSFISILVAIIGVVLFYIAYSFANEEVNYAKQHYDYGRLHLKDTDYIETQPNTYVRAIHRFDSLRNGNQFYSTILDTVIFQSGTFPLIKLKDTDYIDIGGKTYERIVYKIYSNGIKCYSKILDTIKLSPNDLPPHSVKILPEEMQNIGR